MRSGKKAEPYFVKDDTEQYLSSTMVLILIMLPGAGEDISLAKRKD